MVYNMANTVRFLRDIPISNKEVHDADILIIAQPDPTTPSKYRTVNTTLLSMFTTIKDHILTQGIHSFVHVKQEHGLIGVGSKNDPIRLNEDTILKLIIPSQSANISQFGNMRDDRLPISISGSGGVTTVNITESFKCFFNGRTYVIQSQTLKYPLPPDKGKFLLYILSNGPIVEFIGTSLPQAESVDFTLIAHATNLTGDTVTTSKPFIRLDKYRISTEKIGSAIPVSDGFPFDAEFTVWE